MRLRRRCVEKLGRRLVADEDGEVDRDVGDALVEEESLIHAVGEAEGETIDGRVAALMETMSEEEENNSNGN